MLTRGASEEGVWFLIHPYVLESEFSWPWWTVIVLINANLSRSSAVQFRRHHFILLVSLSPPATFSFLFWLSLVVWGKPALWVHCVFGYSIQ